jgi:hypothetical protein
VAQLDDELGGPGGIGRGLEDDLEREAVVRQQEVAGQAEGHPVDGDLDAGPARPLLASAREEHESETDQGAGGEGEDSASDPAARRSPHHDTPPSGLGRSACSPDCPASADRE